MAIRRVLQGSALAAVLGLAGGGVLLLRPQGGANPPNAATPIALRGNTNAGRYWVSAAPKSWPIRVGAVHAWSLRIHDNATGRPAAGARVEVTGGMRGHGHGLPTNPAIEAVAPGEFIVQGVKFSMPGAWNLDFHIDADQRDDQVTFDFTL